MKSLSIAVCRTPILNYTVNEQGKYIFSGYEGRFLQTILQGLGVESESLNIVEVCDAMEMIKVIFTGEADMALAYCVQYYRLSYKIDFSMPYSLASYSFGIRKSIPLETKFSFIYPFTLQVWIGCLIVTLLLPLTYSFMVKTNLSYFEMFSYFWIGIFKPPLEFRRHSLRNRIMVTNSLIFRLIISFSYAAVLLSFMVNPLMSPPIRTFQELSKAAESSNIKVYCVDSTYAKLVFEEADQVYLQSLGQYIEKHNYYYWFDSVDYAKLYAQGAAFVLVVPSLLEVQSVERYSAFISSDNIAYMLVSAFMNKKFQRKKELNSIISRLWQAGIYRKLQSEEAMKARIAMEKSTHHTVSMRPISVENLYGVFMLLIVGYILAFITFVSEIMLQKKRLVSN